MKERMILQNLTPKQKRLVQLRIENPEMSNHAVMIRAGYTKNSALSHSGEPLKSPKVQTAINAILEQTLSEYDKDPRQWVKRTLLCHAIGESGANPGEQIRAVELVGKMTGEFIEKITVDVRAETRRKMVQRFIDA